MKKSDVNVTMPMTVYEGFLAYKNNYNSLVKSILDCFNYDYAVTENRIDFDTNKALALCKSFLPLRFKEKSIVKTE